MQVIILGAGPVGLLIGEQILILFSNYTFRCKDHSVMMQKQFPIKEIINLSVSYLVFETSFFV